MSHVVFALTLNNSVTPHDVYENGGGIALLYDSDAVLQTVKTRLLLHYQEWFLDLSQGLPWFTGLLKHNPDFKLIENRLSETILNTDGVKTLITVALTFVSENRALLVDFNYTDVYGVAVIDNIEIEV